MTNNGDDIIREIGDDMIREMFEELVELGLMERVSGREAWRRTKLGGQVGDFNEYIATLGRRH
jgi:hypothetical protein